MFCTSARYMSREVGVHLVSCTNLVPFVRKEPHGWCRTYVYIGDLWKTSNRDDTARCYTSQPASHIFPIHPSDRGSYGIRSPALSLFRFLPFPFLVCILFIGDSKWRYENTPLLVGKRFFFSLSLSLSKKWSKAPNHSRLKRIGLKPRKFFRRVVVTQFCTAWGF